MAKVLPILTNDATAAHRRIWFDLRDATDGITAETGEAGGQPQISTDGGAWTNTGIGTLSHVGNGRYTADLTQTAVNIAAGSCIETRFKSANTAETPGDRALIYAADPFAALATASALATAQTDLDDIQLRLPAALTTGTADSGTTTTMVDAALTQADADYWKGSWIRFTSGTISGQTRLITAFNAGTDTITFTPATTQAVGTNTYEILPAGAVDIGMISTDATAADSLEAVLDGTGAVLTLTQLRINSTAAGGAIDIDNTTGPAISATGGTNVNSIDIVVGGGNGHGIRSLGLGSGHGIYFTGGATGHGVMAEGGATSGDGIHAESQTLGDGIDAVGKGAGGVGLKATSGNNSDGIQATGAGSGNGINAVAGNTSGIGLRAFSSSTHGFKAEGAFGFEALSNGAFPGFRATGGTDNPGIEGVGTGAGGGIRGTGGATGHGIDAAGGGTSGDGIHAVGTNNGNGFEAIGAGGAAGIRAAVGGSGGAAIQAVGGLTGAGIEATGGATGHGILATGGATSGDGIHALAATLGDGIDSAGAGGGAGIRAAGQGAGSGLEMNGGTTGDGIKSTGGATSGAGINAVAAGTNEVGIRTTGRDAGAGILATGGATGHGLHARSGATSGDGIHAEAQTLGDGVEAIGAGGGFDINADIEGDLNGSVGSVTGDVGGNVNGDLIGDVQGDILGEVTDLAASALAQINTEIDTALADIRLDEFILNVASPITPTIDSFLDRITSKNGAQTYDRATDSLEAIADGGGSSLTQQDVRDAMKLAPTAGAPAAGSVDEHLDDILADTNVIEPLVSTNLDATVSSRATPADIDSSLAAIRLDELIFNPATPLDPTADSFIDLMTSKNAGQTFDRSTDSLEALADSGGGGLTAQQVRDAMKLSPTAGAPDPGSVDEHLDDINADTAAMQPLVDVAISTRATPADVDASLAAIRLDELIFNPAAPADPTADSFLDLITSKDGGQNFDRTTDSLEAIADSGVSINQQDIADALKLAPAVGAPAAGSVYAELDSIMGPGFNPATDSLEEIRDEVDACCGAGGGSSDIINIEEA